MGRRAGRFAMARRRAVRYRCAALGRRRTAAPEAVITRERPAALDLSVVIPLYDEAENVPRLLAEIEQALAGSGLAYEIIAVDDGSGDQTARRLAEALASVPGLRAFRHDRRSGQTAALATGFAQARGDLIATLDGDLQNDPADLPRLVRELGDHDMITGWRRRRHDGPLRRLSSRLANRVRDAVLHDGVVDVGCSTRVFRRACLTRIKLLDGMHRFLPALFQAEGFRVKQVPVNHRPRAGGRSKYGVGNRLWRGLRDLLAVRWMMERTLRVSYREIGKP